MAECCLILLPQHLVCLTVSHWIQSWSGLRWKQMPRSCCCQTNSPFSPSLFHVQFLSIDSITVCVFFYCCRCAVLVRVGSISRLIESVSLEEASQHFTTTQTLSTWFIKPQLMSWRSINPGNHSVMLCWLSIIDFEASCCMLLQ